MCTRGHVISKSEWIGVPALRRAHLLPPAPLGLLPSLPPSSHAGWLHTAANLHFQSWLISDGWAVSVGRAEKSFVRSPHRRLARRGATYLLRVEQWAKERKSYACGLFKNANAIGASELEANEAYEPNKPIGRNVRDMW